MKCETSGQAHVLYAIVVSGSVVAVLPVVILFLFLAAHWQHGLTFGAVRG